MGVELEDDFDLRDTRRSGVDTGKLEVAEEIVVLSHGTFALEDLDEDRGLNRKAASQDVDGRGEKSAVVG